MFPKVAAKRPRSRPVCALVPKWQLHAVKIAYSQNYIMSKLHTVKITHCQNYILSKLHTVKILYKGDRHEATPHSSFMSAAESTSVQQRLAAIVASACELRRAIRNLPATHPSQPMLNRVIECMFDNIVELATRLNVTPAAGSAVDEASERHHISQHVPPDARPLPVQQMASPGTPPVRTPTRVVRHAVEPVSQSTRVRTIKCTQSS